MENKTSRLTKSELIDFVELGKKRKDKYVGIKLSAIELDRYKQLALKQDVALSTLMRDTLRKYLFHFKINQIS